ncbi:aspartyl/glutamyl-tRNA(Asn/Gln) amidotransferase subunit B [Rhodotorula toruloides]|uniref:Altered inheritance of mitochondria protein 41 n=1 Tax=Rhodotorula toruloides TaxID=5286 RepID=A0A511KHV8_RHOTO|nr:aspartyl/glutamyl-tRNA(Asn/Gln) amidotransferase subunit B [Rhodotorula toruloides]
MYTLRAFQPALRLTARLYSTATQSHPLVASLRAALKQSMLARTPERTAVIKSILADIQTAAHSASTAPSPLKTLATAITKRLDAAQTFRSSTPPRTDLAEQYEKEAAMLREFVPSKGAQLTREELDRVVKELFEENEVKKAVGKDVGRIISLVKERVGDRAESKDVAEAVRTMELP